MLNLYEDSEYCGVKNCQLRSVFSKALTTRKKLIAAHAYTVRKKVRGAEAWDQTLSAWT